MYIRNSDTKIWSNPFGNNHPHISTKGECKHWYSLFQKSCLGTKPNPNFYTINRYHVKSIYSIPTAKLTGILLEIIILTLAQKADVNSNVLLSEKAVFEGTLPLAHTLIIDIISNVYMEFLHQNLQQTYCKSSSSH